MKVILQIKDIILKKKINDSSLSGYLVKGTFGTLIIQALTVLLTFLSNFIAARLLGPEEYGTFTYLFTCIAVFANIAVLGFNSLFIREAAVYKSKSEWGRLKGLVTIASVAVVVASVVLMILGLPLFKTFDVLSKIGDISLFRISLIALPLVSLILLYQSVLQGLQKIIAGQLAEKIIRPLVFIFLITAVYFVDESNISITSFIWLNVISFGVALTFVIVSVNKNVSPFFKTVKANYENNKWLKSSMYFFVSGIVQVINSRIDVLLLGVWKGSKDVGIYNVAIRLSDFITMSLFIVNMVIAPSISNLYHNQQKEKLQMVVTSGARIAFLFSLPVIFFLVLGGKFILSLFGEAFILGYTPMLIIIAAQIVNVASGSVGYILMMTRNEKYVFVGLLISLVMNIGLNVLLTPYYGVNGTALAVAASIVTLNGIMLFFVRKKTKIFPTALGNF